MSPATIGQPVNRADVEVGRWRDFEHYRTRTESDGSFILVGLPVGDVEVRAEHDDFRRR